MKLKDSTDLGLQRTLGIQLFIALLWIGAATAIFAEPDRPWWMGWSNLSIGAVQLILGIIVGVELVRRGRASRAQAARFSAMDATREPTIVHLDGRGGDPTIPRV